MKVLKPFVRDGQRYQRGDPAPAGVDGPALKHYLRYGMVSAEGAKPAQTNTSSPPSAPRQTKPTGPKETKPVGPKETKEPSGSASQEPGSAQQALEKVGP